MGILQRIVNFIEGAETRALPDDPYWSNWAAMRGTVGMVPASADSVLSNLAVAARCIQLRSEILASVPLFLFRRTDDGGRDRADDNPLYGVLHDISNATQSAFEFRELMVRSLDLYGNFYARIERNARGQVTALWPLMPGDVEVRLLPNGRLQYKVFTGSRNETFLQEEILHVRGASRDGIIGLSPIAIARGALSLALAHAQMAAAFTSNGLRPSGLVSFPDRMSVDQKQHFRETAAGEYGGTTNAGRLMVVDGGAKYEKLSFSPEDAQFLEQRKLANEDVARIFGTPPTAIGILDKATFSNIEQESRNLVQNSIGPLAARIETAMARCLLTDVGRRSLYVEHDLNGLLRGDVAARFESYRIAREIGVFSANDVRRLENQPPIPDGDGYNMPVNWMKLGGTPPEGGGTNG
jgi:HK97 family phage portal protein